MIKIYTILYDNLLYGYTTDKELRNNFREQRITDFRYGKIEYDGTETEFQNDYDVSYKSCLTKDIVSTMDDTDIFIVLTIEEYDNVKNISDTILLSHMYIENNIDKFIFKKDKYREAIDNLSHLTIKYDSIISYVYMDTLSMVVDLYGHLFKNKA